ncbi:KTSC domain-containing protein [Bacteroidota bacterium]
MKRIGEYRKLFGTEETSTLKQLKTSYRNLVKEWHPDKFREGDAKAQEAEEMSRVIIDGYKFLVGIAPETKAAKLETYEKTISESGIIDYLHKGLLLEVTFGDGMTYEYYGVPRNVFLKFHNSDKQVRFAKRNIFYTYQYRLAKDAKQEEPVSL